jgi:hypothetical protein
VKEKISGWMENLLQENSEARKVIFFWNRVVGGDLNTDTDTVFFKQYRSVVFFLIVRVQYASEIMSELYICTPPQTTLAQQYQIELAHIHIIEDYVYIFSNLPSIHIDNMS